MPFFEEKCVGLYRLQKNMPMSAKKNALLFLLRILMPKQAIDAEFFCLSLRKNVSVVVDYEEIWPCPLKKNELPFLLCLLMRKPASNAKIFVFL